MTDLTPWTHSDLIDGLCDLYERRAFVAQQELRAKIETFQRSDQPSVAARERDAAWAALEFSVELLELDARIKCLEVRLAHAAG